MFVVTYSFQYCCLPFSYLHFQGQGQRANVTFIEFIGFVVKSCFMVDIRLIFSTKRVMWKVNTKRQSLMPVSNDLDTCIGKVKVIY